ncbi:hypothetical protein [Bradyrhizobium sp. USDA 3256]
MLGLPRFLEISAAGPPARYALSNRNTWRLVTPISCAASLGRIEDDQAGFAAPRDNRRQFPRHTPAGDRRVRNGAQTFLGDIVDDIEDARRPDLVQ